MLVVREQQTIKMVVSIHGNEKHKINVIQYNKNDFSLGHGENYLSLVHFMKNWAQRSRERGEVIDLEFINLQKIIDNFYWTKPNLLSFNSSGHLLYIVHHLLDTCSMFGFSTILLPIQYIMISVNINFLSRISRLSMSRYRKKEKKKQKQMEERGKGRRRKKK